MHHKILGSKKTLLGIFFVLLALAGSGSFYALSAQKFSKDSIAPGKDANGGSNPSGNVLPPNAIVEEENIIRMVVSIRGSLARSVWRATVKMQGYVSDDSEDESLKQDMFAGYVYHLIDRIMQWRIDIEKDYNRGDRIVILIEPYEDPKREWIVRIIALDYKGKKGSFRAYFFHETERKFGAHYDPNGYELALHLESSPIDSWQEITSLWGDRRNHKGIDFKCPKFTPLHAPMAGTVTRMNWRTRANGNCLELESGDSPLVMKFLHLEKFPKEVHERMKVEKGELIGYTGNTGHSSAPHLHFQVEVKLNPVEVEEGESPRIPVDPYWILDSCENQIMPVDYEAFEIKTQKYKSLLFPDGE